MLLFSLSLPFVSFSQVNPITDKPFHPTDRVYNHCVDAPEVESTAGMISCAQLGLEAWDETLNDYYQRLEDKLSREEFTKLRDAQRAWLKFRDAELNFMGDFYTNLDGSMYRMIAANHALELTRDRAIELWGYIQLVEY